MEPWRNRKNLQGWLHRRLSSQQEQGGDRETSRSKKRLVYNPENNTIDLGAKRATDMGHNQRLFMPQPRSPQEEAVLSARLGVWRGVTNNFIDKECNKEGKQNVDNLTTQEKIGLNKLCKRAKDRGHCPFSKLIRVISL